MIFLAKLTLKDFKCYENKCYQFAHGVNWLCGPNGAGKSSILEAISWALFNFLPYTSQASVIKRGAKVAEVEVTLKQGERTFLLRRRTGGQSASVTDLDRGVLLAEGVSGLESWVKGAFGLRPRENLQALCRNAIAPPQGTLTQDFLKTPQERRKTFDALLGLDDYELLDVKMKQTIDIVEKEMIEARIHLAENKLEEGVEEQIAAQVSELNLALEQALLDQKKLQSEIQNQSSALKQAAEKRKAAELLGSKILLLEAKLSDLAVSLASLDQVQTRESELAPQAKRFEEIRLQLTKLASTRAELKLSEEKSHALNALSQKMTFSAQRANAELAALRPKLAGFASLARDYQLYQERESEERGLFFAEAELLTSLSELPELEASFETLRKSLADRNIELSKEETERVSAELLPQLKKEIEDLRFEYKQVHDLEIELEKLGSLPASFKLQASLGQTEQSLERARETLQGHLAEQRVRAEFLPKLYESQFCPLLGSPCQNLLATNGALAVPALESPEESINKQQSLQANIQTLEAHHQELKQTLSQAERSEELSAKLARRESQKLAQQGKSWREKLEIAEKSALWLAGLLSLKAQQEKDRLEETRLLNKLATKQEEKSKLNSLQASLAELRAYLLEHETLKSNFLEQNLLASKEQEYLAEEQRCLNALQSLKPELDSLSQSTLELQEKLILLESLEQEAHQLAEPANIWREAKTELERLLALQKTAQSTAENLHQLKTDLDLLGELLDPKTTESWQNELANKQTELGSLTERVQNKTEAKTQAQAQLSKIQAQKAQQAASQQKYQKLEKESQQAQKMRALFKEMSLRLAKRLTEGISQKASSLYAEILQDGSNELKWSDSYAIKAVRLGQELSFEGLSGGQQVAASIAVRLALIQEVSGLGFAFFDEPTAHLDQARREQLALQIGNIESFSQLFVITHDESFAGQANNLIQVLP